MNDKELLQELIDAANLDQELTPKQKRIMEAAIEMFAEKGYAATSTSEIAKKAEVAEGTIFKHYKTKKELLLGIVTPVIVKFAYPFFLSPFIKAVFHSKHKSYEEMLRTLIANRYEFAKKNRALMKIFLQEMAFHSEIKQTFQTIFEKEVYPKFMEAINQFKKEGQLIDYPAESILRLTVTSLAGFLITRFVLLPDYDWDDEAEIERTLQFTLKELSPSDKVVD